MSAAAIAAPLALLRRVRARATVSAVMDVMVLRMLALAGNVCSGLLTAALLGPAGRGEQAALILGPQLLAMVATLGLHASFIYNTKADPEQEGRYLGAALLLAPAAALLGIVGFWLALPHWLGQYSAETIAEARWLLWLAPFGVATPLLTGVLELRGRFRLANRVLYLQSLGTILLLLLLWAAGALTPHSSALAYLLPAVPVFLYLLRVATRAVRPRLGLGAPYPQRLLRYGLRFYGVDLLGTLSNYIDQMVIVLVLQPAAVGAYAVALSLARILAVLQGAVSTVLFPSIAARGAASAVATAALAARVATAVNTAAAIGLGIVGPHLLLWLYGEAFAAAILPFQILLAETVLSNAARILAQAYSGSGRPGVVTLVESAAVAVSFGAMLLLVPRFGLIGAALAMLLAGLLRLAAVLAGFRLVLGLGLPRLVIGRADLAWVMGR